MFNTKKEAAFCMNNKSYVSCPSGTKQRSRNYLRFRKKYRKSTKVIAISLAFIMAFSAFSANISSIVSLLQTFAADGTEGQIYYETDLTLYDYYTDQELKGSYTGSDGNANDTGKNENSIFNKALYYSGYTTSAGTKTQFTNNQMHYYPLYLGLQYPKQIFGNQMITDAGNKYLYSIIANSEAGTEPKSALVFCQISSPP